MPPNTIYVGRPSKFQNPFKVGGYYLLGDPVPSYKGPFVMTYSQACRGNTDERFTLIRTRQQACDFFREYVARFSYSRAELMSLRGHNLACWCPLIDKDGKHVSCHADVLLEIANA